MHAIEFTFDDRANEHIAELCRELQAADVDPIPGSGDIPIRPHVSLALGEGLHHVDYRQLATTLEPLGSVSFDAAAMFPSAESVLFAAPRPSSTLMRLHQSVHDYLRGIPVDLDERYVPGRWVPHMTLAMGVPPELVGAAMEIALWHLPIAAQIVRISLADVETGQTVRIA